jgi:hypothetical protein
MDTNSVADFQQWQTGATPMLTSMMAVLYGAQDATTRTPEAILSASDQLLAASADAVRWLPDHRCPFAGLDSMLTRLACAYGDAAELLALQARRPSGPDRIQLDSALTGLIGMLAVTWAVIREQAQNATAGALPEPRRAP